MERTGPAVATTTGSAGAAQAASAAPGAASCRAPQSRPAAEGITSAMI